MRVTCVWLQVCYGRPKEAHEEVVLLSQVLACDATVGYEDVSNVQVRNRRIERPPTRPVVPCSCLITFYARFACGLRAWSLLQPLSTDCSCLCCWNLPYTLAVGLLMMQEAKARSRYTAVACTRLHPFQPPESVEASRNLPCVLEELVSSGGSVHSTAVEVVYCFSGASACR